MKSFSCAMNHHEVRLGHSQSDSGTHGFTVLCHFLVIFLSTISTRSLGFALFGGDSELPLHYSSPGSNWFLFLFCMRLTFLVYEQKWKCRQSQGYSRVFYLPKSVPSSSGKTSYFSFGELTFISLPLVCWDFQSGDLFFPQPMKIT